MPGTMMMPQNFMTRSVFGLLLCLLLAATTHARQQQDSAPAEQGEDEVLRISTELVQTDVVVLDKQGHFVEGLKPEQFELKVDGKPQPIAFFDRVTTGSASEETQLLAARGGARPAALKEAPRTTIKRGRTIIFFVDDLHMSADSLNRVRKLLLRLIDNELDADDLAVVASPASPIGFLKQFTNNKTVLRAAVARLSYQPYAASDNQRPQMSEFQAQAIDRNDQDVMAYFVEQVVRENPRMPATMAASVVKQRAQQILRQASFVTLNMVSALDSLMRNSISLPGRKIAFFFSDGFFLDNRSSDTQERFRRATTAAARAGVVIYTLESRGLVTGMSDPTREEVFDPRGRFARMTATAEIAPSQDALHSLAEETGGRAFVNTNALDSLLRSAFEEMSRYYLLAWRPNPETNRGGKFRRIEVSITGRSDLKVRARRGFLPEAANPRAKQGDARATPPATAKTADGELRDAINSMLPQKALRTSLSANYIDLPENGLLLTIAMKIPGDALTYTPVADKLGAVVDVVGGVFNDQGQLLSSFKDELKPVASSTDQSALRSQRVIYTSQLAVKPGLYQVRVAARDAQSKRTGSATEWIEVPDLKSGRLTLSGLFISERAAKQGQAQAGEDAFKLANLNVDRRFAKTSKLLFLAYIYNAARGATPPDAPDVTIQAEVYSGHNLRLKTPLRKVPTEELTDLARLPYAAEIPLTSLAAGRYTLRLAATDRTARMSASQSVTFEVE